MSLTTEERINIEKAIYDLIYDTNFFTPPSSSSREISRRDQLLGYIEDKIRLSEDNVKLTNFSNEVKIATRIEENSNSILEQAIINGKFEIANNLLDIEILSLTIDERRFGLLQQASENNNHAKSILKQINSLEQNSEEIQEDEEYVKVVKTFEYGNIKTPKSDLIRADQLERLEGNIQPLFVYDVNKTDGWVIEDTANPVNNNEINIFFMGTAGAPLFGGHKDIYEGGDVLCNLAMQKALVDNKRVMLMRGVGTTVMESDQPLTYLKDPKATTLGTPFGNVYGTKISKRIRTAMERYYIPQMIEIIDQGTLGADGKIPVNVNITGHSRGAITTFALADCIEQWKESLRADAKPKIDLNELARNICTKNNNLNHEKVIAALQKIRNNETRLNTRLLAYDPVEGRTGLGNIAKGYAGNFTADYNLKIYGNDVNFSYSAMPPSVKEARVMLAQAEYREAFQPTIPKFHKDTQVDYAVVVGGHGTMKGNLSNHTDDGQDSYNTAQNQLFIREAGRALVDLGKADATPFLFRKNLPPFQLNTLINIFSSNEGQGYVNTKNLLLEAINDVDFEYDDRIYSRIFAKLTLNAGQPELTEDENKSLLILHQACEQVMISNPELSEKLYFDLARDVHEIYLSPTDPIKVQMLGQWFKEMKEDTTDAGLKLFTTDADQIRKVWMRDKGEKMQLKPLTSIVPFSKYEPKLSMLYPDAAQIGGLESKDDGAYYIDQRYTNPYMFDLENQFSEEEKQNLNEKQRSELTDLSLEFYKLNKIGVKYAFSENIDLKHAFDLKAIQYIEKVTSSALPQKAKVKILATLAMKSDNQYKIHVKHHDKDFIRKYFTESNKEIYRDYGPDISNHVSRYHIEKMVELINLYRTQDGASSKNYRENIKEAQKLLTKLREDGVVRYEYGAYRYNGLDIPLKLDVDFNQVTRLLENDSIKNYLDIDRQIQKYKKAIIQYREPEGSKFKKTIDVAAKGAGLAGGVAGAAVVAGIATGGVGALVVGAAAGGYAAYKGKNVVTKNPEVEIIESKLRALEQRLIHVKPDKKADVNAIQQELEEIYSQIDRIKSRGLGEATSRKLLLASYLPNYEKAKHLHNFIISERPQNIGAKGRELLERKEGAVLCDALVRVIDKRDRETLIKVLESPSCVDCIKNSPLSDKLLDEAINVGDAHSVKTLLLADGINFDFVSKNDNGETLLQRILQSPYLQSCNKSAYDHLNKAITEGKISNKNALAQDGSGSTLLHYLMRDASLEDRVVMDSMMWVLQGSLGQTYNSDLNIKNNVGKTPLDILMDNPNCDGILNAINDRKITNSVTRLGDLVRAPYQIQDFFDLARHSKHQQHILGYNFDELYGRVKTDSKVYNMLLDLKANVNYPKALEMCFSKAVQERDIDLINSLIKAEPTLIDKQFSNGDTALLFAVKNEDLVFASTLLELNARRSLKDADGNAALHYLALMPDSKDAICKLLQKYTKRGDPGKVTNHDLDTPLHLLVKAGRLDILKAIDISCKNTYYKEHKSGIWAQLGNAIEMKNHNGMTPIMIAALTGNLEIIDLLSGPNIMALHPLAVKAYKDIAKVVGDGDNKERVLEIVKSYEATVDPKSWIKAKMGSLPGFNKEYDHVNPAISIQNDVIQLKKGGMNLR